MEPAPLDDQVMEQFLRKIQPAQQSPAERGEEAQEPAQTIAGALTITKTKAYLDPFPVMGPSGEIGQSVPGIIVGTQPSPAGSRASCTE
jgi:hypothetical protein